MIDPMALVVGGVMAVGAGVGAGMVYFCKKDEKFDLAQNTIGNRAVTNSKSASERLTIIEEFWTILTTNIPPDPDLGCTSGCSK